MALLVGVAGGTAAGKTALVQALARRVGRARVAVIRHDWYYRDRAQVPEAERALWNYDHPDALETSLLVAHLEELRCGRPVDAPSYDFATHSRAPQTQRLEPRELIVLDGILVLHDPELRSALDLRVWVEADDEVRFLRRMDRDTRERGRTVESVLRQYRDTVRPMHAEFVEPSRRYADLVLDGQGEFESALAALRDAIAARWPGLEPPDSRAVNSTA